MPLNVSDEELKKQLNEEQYYVLREKGTERPFSGKLLHNKKSGVYRCGVCNAVLFTSDTKFDSGSGWPSFSDMAEKGAVTLSDDNSHGMHRVEATCTNCGSHLGHVFDYATQQSTGQYFCINSVALKFEKKDDT